MNIKQFNKILQIVRRTGDKIAIPDTVTDRVMLLMDSDEYDFITTGEIDQDQYVENEYCDEPCLGSADDCDCDCDCNLPFDSFQNDFDPDLDTNFDIDNEVVPEPDPVLEDIKDEDTSEIKDTAVENTPDLDKKPKHSSNRMVPIEEIINKSSQKLAIDSAPLYIESESDQGFEAGTPENLPDFGEINIEEPLDDVVDETELEELEFKPEPLE